MKRTYIVPLRRGYRNTQRPQRAKKAVSVLRDFLKRHMKSADIKLSAGVNELLWQNGIKNPPGKITVDCEKTPEGVVYVGLEGEGYSAPVEQSEEETAKKTSTPQAKAASEQPAKKETPKTEDVATEESEEPSEEEKKE